MPSPQKLRNNHITTQRHKLSFIGKNSTTTNERTEMTISRNGNVDKQERKDDNNNNNNTSLPSLPDSYHVDYHHEDQSIILTKRMIRKNIPKERDIVNNDYGNGNDASRKKTTRRRRRRSDDANTTTTTTTTKNTGPFKTRRSKRQRCGYDKTSLRINRFDDTPIPSSLMIVILSIVAIGHFTTTTMVSSFIIPPKMIPSPMTISSSRSLHFLSSSFVPFPRRRRFRLSIDDGPRRSSRVVGRHDTPPSIHHDASPHHHRRLVSLHSHPPSPPPPPSPRHISADYLQRLKNAASILDVVSSHPSISHFSPSPDGSTATCLCPFHDDRHPSLSLSRELQMYKCWSCGASGDVFRFVREMERVETGREMGFVESVRRVVVGFTDWEWREEEEGGGDDEGGRRWRRWKETEERRRRLLLANTHAAHHYQQNLFSPSAGHVRHYLQHRRISPRAVRTFGMGYASPHRGLVTYLRGLNFTDGEMIDAGLALRRSSKGHATAEEEEEEDELYDRFRHRLMIPIFSPTDDYVIGFGGRALAEGRGPKYLNSPQTDIFSKRDTLFRGSKTTTTTTEAKRDVIMVEGYFDVVSLWDDYRDDAERGGGGGNETSIVACMGTSVTREQLELAAGMATGGGRIILCLDNDKAGHNALERLCTSSLLPPIESSTSVPILIATLPANISDPSDFVERNPETSSCVSQITATARPWLHWYLQNILLTKYHPPDAPGHFGSICNDLSSLLSTFSENPAERTRMVHSLSQLLTQVLYAEEGNETWRTTVEENLIKMTQKKANERERRGEKMKRWEERSKLEQESREGLKRGQQMKKRRYGSGVDGDRSGGGNVKRQPVEDARIVTTSEERNNQQQTERLGKRYTTNDNSRPRRGQSSPSSSSALPQFANKDDLAWLGLDKRDSFKKKRETTLGIPPYSRTRKRNKNGDDDTTSSLYSPSNLVYFDSNDKNDDDASLRTLRSNPHRILRDAEHRLLQTMIHFPSARKHMMNAVQAHKKASQKQQQQQQQQSKTETGDIISWTDSSRKWLFQKLLTDDNIPCHHDEAREYLTTLPDLPPGTLDPSSSSIASIFQILPEDHLLPPRSPSDRSRGAERTIRSTLTLILKCSAELKLETLQKRWIASYDTPQFDSLTKQIARQFATVTRLNDLCRKLNERTFDAVALDDDGDLGDVSSNSKVKQKYLKRLLEETIREAEEREREDERRYFDDDGVGEERSGLEGDEETEDDVSGETEEMTEEEEEEERTMLDDDMDGILEDALRTHAGDPDVVVSPLSSGNVVANKNDESLEEMMESMISNYDDAVVPPLPLDDGVTKEEPSEEKITMVNGNNDLFSKSLSSVGSTNVPMGYNIMSKNTDPLNGKSTKTQEEMRTANGNDGGLSKIDTYQTNGQHYNIERNNGQDDDRSYNREYNDNNNNHNHKQQQEIPINTIPSNKNNSIPTFSSADDDYINDNDIIYDDSILSDDNDDINMYERIYAKSDDYYGIKDYEERQQVLLQQQSSVEKRRESMMTKDKGP